ncbi:MAG: ATP synthase subunit I [Rhodospirillales bacterium]|nr:ATP synthase subunit I [Rhodospirillales bacterium]MCB9973819.1 ATP synthase subunit I [Rhodospirillales bacterium]
MNDISIMALALSAGIVLGFIFYGGLWWTVRKGLSSAYAPWIFMGSFWLRLAIALGGFYIVAQGDWKNLLACFAGFMLGRIAVRLLTREPSHAA